MTREPASGKASGICRDVRHPRKQSNLRQGETASVSEILRQPRDVEPPNGISNQAGQDDRPDLAIAKQISPAVFRDRVCQWRGVFPDELQLFLRDPTMLLGRLIKQ